MELEYVYTKLRSDFGRQCLFVDKHSDIIDQIAPDHNSLRDYIHRNPVNQSSQCSAVQAEHTVNTESRQFSNNSMNHTEGGWPKDVNLNDEEQPKRYRRKIEKDENYVHTVLKLAKNIEQYIVQNTSVNIYQHYFCDLEPAPLVEKNWARTVNVYQDQTVVTRPVTHISWSPDFNKLAISYCDTNFQNVVDTRSFNSYIWEVENPNCPHLVLSPPAPLVCLEYHMKDSNCLVAGMLNGQVSLWDARRGHDLINSSVYEESHLDPVRSVKWINSKTGSEFFSGSSDGQCKWWDIRKLSAPTENLILDMVRFGEDQSLPRAQGVSSLEYETTIPTRFMVGTEHGCVISGNRKGKTPNEKLMAKFNAHLGPVYALQRNSSFLKNFLTVGDWTAKIWTEECKDNAIIVTKYYDCSLTGGIWSPTRYSVYFLTRFDGTLDAWDILQTQKHPALSVKLCDEPLQCLSSHEMGRLIALGNRKGTTYLVELSENFAENRSYEKTFLAQMFDRESHREKILEGRLRELRLKSKLKSSGEYAEEFIESYDAVKVAEEEFYSIIEEETKPPHVELPELPPEPEPEPPPPEPEPEPVVHEEKKKGKKKGKK